MTGDAAFKAEPHGAVADHAAKGRRLVPLTAVADVRVFATGVGAEVLAPMARPILGGLLISDEVVDLFLPVRFYWARRARWLKLQAAGQLAHQQSTQTETLPPPTDRMERPAAPGATEGVA